MSNVDAILKQYAEKATAMHENNTVGDFSFHGLLAEFARDFLVAEQGDEDARSESLTTVENAVANMEIPEGVTGEKAEGYRMARYAARKIVADARNA